MHRRPMRWVRSCSVPGIGSSAERTISTPTPPNEEFHRTRISVKRARYAAELAARSLPGKAAGDAARLGERLAGLQDLLGDVQDAAVAEALIRDTLAARGAGARYAFEAGRLVERLRSRADRSRSAFLEEWPEVRRRRWRKWAM